MIELITITIMLTLNGLMCNGLYLATRPGMALDFVDKWTVAYAGRFYNAICGCITCMASIWSLPFWLVSHNPIYYVGYIFALAAVNTAIYNTFFDEQ
jgi:hypothetical protein